MFFLLFMMALRSFEAEDMADAAAADVEGRGVIGSAAGTGSAAAAAAAAAEDEAGGGVKRNPDESDTGGGDGSRNGMNGLVAADTGGEGSTVGGRPRISAMSASLSSIESCRTAAGAAGGGDE